MPKSGDAIIVKGRGACEDSDEQPGVITEVKSLIMTPEGTYWRINAAVGDLAAGDVKFFDDSGAARNYSNEHGGPVVGWPAVAEVSAPVVTDIPDEAPLPEIPDIDMEGTVIETPKRKRGSR